MPVNYVEASGKDVAEIVALIEDAVEGYPNFVVAMACIAVAILSQNQEVAPDQMRDIVQGATEYIAASLSNESPSGAVN